MNKRKLQPVRGEKGQMLVLIVLGIVVLFGFAALAVDGGIVYSGRRAAQNAADAAALSASYAMCQGNDEVAAAMDIAAKNGFTDNGGDTRVTVNNPPLSGPYAGNNDYSEVIIDTVAKPVFSGFVYKGTLASTARAVSHCHKGTGGTTSQPGLGGEVSLLALNPSDSCTISNTGGAVITVDGGVFVNSTKNSPADNPTNMAFCQDGSAQMIMNWAKIRGGARLGGAFGITGAGTIAQQIDVVGNFNTSGSGMAVAGVFNIGGDVYNSASVNMTGRPMNVGGYFNNNGAGTVVATALTVVSDLTNNQGGSITAETITVGGNVKADGGTLIKPPSGKTLTMLVTGNVTLGGSAQINGNVTRQGSYSPSGTGAITGTNTVATVTKPTFSMGNNPSASPLPTIVIGAKADPLAAVLTPPTAPTGSCTNISIPNWGTSNPTMTNNGYYCNLNVGGSVTATIPPGKYWTDYFNLSGSATLKMDGVHLFITGKGTSNAFQIGGSAHPSMAGTMIYIQSGSFSISGASGPSSQWTAPGAGDIYNGLALFMDRTNTSTASVSGSSWTSPISGTWYAPAASCTFSGATSSTIYSQFICDKITVNGSAALTIMYDSKLVYEIPGTSSTSDVSLDE